MAQLTDNKCEFFEEFVTSTGVPQGCPISLLMYILFLNNQNKSGVIDREDMGFASQPILSPVLSAILNPKS